MSQNDDLLRGEPHSVDAERTTLGTLLLDPERIIDVAPTVQPEDFYDPVYRTIYTAIRDLHEKRKPIDFVTVADALKTDEKIQSIGGSTFLMSLVKDVPTSAHGVHYAAIVREKAMHRELLHVGAAITKVAGNEKLELWGEFKKLGVVKTRCQSLSPGHLFDQRFSQQ